MHLKHSKFFFEKFVKSPILHMFWSWVLKMKKDNFIHFQHILLRTAWFLFINANTCNMMDVDRMYVLVQ